MKDIPATIFSLALAGCAAHAQPAPADTPRFLSADEVVAARQATMRLTAMNMKAMKDVIDSGADPKTMAFAAGGMAKWGQALPTMFPPSLSSDRAKVTPALTSDRAGFDAAAASFSANTAQLFATARASDRDGFASAWTAVRGDCDTCHKANRVD